MNGDIVYKISPSQIWVAKLYKHKWINNSAQMVSPKSEIAISGTMEVSCSVPDRLPIKAFSSYMNRYIRELYS